MLSLKRKIILFFLIVGIIPALIISIYYYQTSIAVIEENITENRQVVLKNILSRYEKQIDNLMELTDWFFREEDISELLRNPLDQIDDFNKKIIEASENIKTQVTFSQLMPYVSSIFLHGNNGLDLRYSNHQPVYLINIDELLNEDWIKRSRMLHGKSVWSDPVPKIHKQFDEDFLVPLVRTISNIDDIRLELGILVVLINERIFNEIYSSMELDKNEILFFTYSSGTVFSSSNRDYIGININEFPFMEKNTGHKHFYYKDSSSNSLVITEKSQNYGWQIINLVPMYELQNQQNKILTVSVIVFLFSLLLTIGLSAFLTSNINKPINNLIVKVKKFSKADFSHKTGTLKKDEIGLLEESINNMAVEIEKLMKAKISEEKEKHDIELKMLQSQINPHFLYNSLNTIKWMAVLQGSAGISDMVTSLSKILKYSLEQISEKVTLSEELEALDDYIHIQRIGYKKRITFRKNIKDKNLLSCLVMKFILQPVIENSIIHGIKPKMSPGKIELTVENKNKSLYISIHDNGMGIPENKIKELNNLKQEENPNGIGLINVKRRVQLLYGKKYGLKVSGELGKYTEVKIHIPLEIKDK